MVLEECFHDLLEEWWLSFCFAGTPSTVLWLKLKALKEKLKEWNKETFGNIDSRLNHILTEIQGFDLIVVDNVLDERKRKEK